MKYIKICSKAQYFKNGNKDYAEALEVISQEEE